MEVHWVAMFPEGTSLSDVRLFFVQASIKEGSLRCMATSDTFADGADKAPPGRYEFVVEKAPSMPPTVLRRSSTWNETLFDSAVLSPMSPAPHTKWVHRQHQCKVGHWHGTKIPAENCKYCNSSAYPPCGGASWEDMRLAKNRAYLPFLNRLAWRALIDSRVNHPFSDFDDDGLPTEDALHHVFHVETGEWEEELVHIKRQKTPFAKGALRAAYKMKMIDREHHNAAAANGVVSAWQTAPAYVAKSFICESPTDRDKIRDDVVLQMTAKHYAQLFNKRGPPKTIDFLQASYIKTLARPNRRLAVETYVSGDFHKYNNNSGAVYSDYGEGYIPHTPNAFSHFTYVASGKRLMVVDIQGVSDLYTDPQIHSVNENEYGEGNLGIAGMALFAFSHRCNQVCAALQLPPFDLYREEEDEPVLGEEAGSGKFHRAQSVHDLYLQCHEKDNVAPALRRESSSRRVRPSKSAHLTRADFPAFYDIDFDLIPVEAKDETDALIHLRLALYHQVGRFSAVKEPNPQAALYHFQKAAQLGSMPALMALAKLHSDATCHEDVLPMVSLEDKSLAFKLLLAAASRGNKHAMANAALAYHNGYYMEKDLGQAVRWYALWLETPDPPAAAANAFGWEMHGLKASSAQRSLAELYDHGGAGLEPDLRQAREWYETAAESLSNEGSFNLMTKCMARAEELETILESQE